MAIGCRDVVKSTGEPGAGGPIPERDDRITVIVLPDDIDLILRTRSEEAAAFLPVR